MWANKKFKITPTSSCYAHDLVNTYKKVTALAAKQKANSNIKVIKVNNIFYSKYRLILAARP